METCDKEDKGGPSDEQSKNLFTSASAHLTEDYVHNPEEFIDIHGDHRKGRATLPEKTDLDNSEPVIVADTVKTDLNVPVTNENSEAVNSLSASNVIQNLKVPVQVSEGSDINDDRKLKNKDDSSDEEYQSADDGDGHSNREREEDSEDEFIPVGGENDYAEDEDHGKAFCKNDNASVFEENELGDREPEEQERESNIIDDMEVRRNLEEQLTEEERQERKVRSQKLKDDGNAIFRNGDYDEAIIAYSEALEICPLNLHKERSIMFANRAACKMKKELYEGAIQDSTSALELHPHYLKAILRRAELYERTEKLDEALTDYQKVVELDPSQGMARAACVKLAEQIKDRNEKMKGEMIGKLKDLGNLVLRPFGLSVNNFNLQQDPKTGSYSVQFQQSPPRNGS
uniref:Uncharacterized protein n=2 Tax=Arion vulgaris TaxID=1028688 RepID=A0A0B6ZLW2_9EUPU